MKIKTSELIGTALDWAVAKCEGAAMRSPRPATDEDVTTLQTPFDLYEVVTLHADGELVEARVAPITVTRHGVNSLVGATAPSITAIDEQGDKFLGSVRDYYLDKAEAELEAQGMLRGFAGQYQYSTDWSQSGPIIERIGGFLLKCWLDSRPDLKCEAHINNYEGNWVAFGPTLLIAAMRCYVASQLGDEVEIPKEFL